MSEEIVRPINRFARKQAWVFRGKGPTGRNLCFCGCAREVKPPRRSAFSDECVAWHNERSNAAHIRAKVERRDRGVCALCGLDTVQESRVARETISLWHWLARKEAERLFLRGELIDERTGLVCEPAWSSVSTIATRWVHEQIEARGWNNDHFWEADHIVPVIEGGGGCDFTGYRTLCIWCHRKETAALAGRRAVRRKEALTKASPQMEWTP